IMMAKLDSDRQRNKTRVNNGAVFKQWKEDLLLLTKCVSAALGACIQQKQRIQSAPPHFQPTT
uniref:Uncharacterized protein n=1 Tax=Fundulus heteroclitus TaxID=8078 RepID=A0A3Q2Q6H8_FUNHE